MKKLHAIYGLMMAAIVALSGCQPKEQVEVLVYPDTFSVTASLDGTKTTNGGLSTLWAENDAINVFFTQDNTFQSAGKLTLSDGADTKKGVFTAESSPAVGTGEHDWYAVYPYNDKRTSPASYTKEDGYVYVGDTRGLTQSVYNVLDVVCGSACPMYAVAKNVTGTNPAFTMKQLASVIEFKVVNKTGAPLKVSSVTLDESESGEAVVGSFFMDFTGEAPVYTKSDDSSYWSSLAVTRIANPGELAVDEAAFVYMPIKPYTHVDTQDFKVIVEGEQGGKEGKAVLTLRPAAEKCTFAAGKIKTVTLNVETFEVDPDPAFVFNTEEAITALGQLVPGADNDGATSLDGVTLTSTDGIQLSFSKGSASTVPRLWKTSTAYELRFYKGNTLSFAAPAGYSIVRIAFDGAKADKTATSYPEGYFAGEWTGKSSTVLLYPGEPFNVDKIFVVLESGDAPLEPWLTVRSTSLNIGAAASTTTVAVSSDDAGWTVSTTASWFTVEKDGDTVKISAEANDSDKERSELFVVKHATSSLLEVNVTVTQEAGEAPGPGPEPEPSFVFNTAQGLAALGLSAPTAGNDGAVNLDAQSIISSDGIQLSFVKGAASNEPRLWMAADESMDLRFYNKNELIFKAPEGKSIVSIVFAGGKIGAATSKPEESYTAGKWEGKSSTVVLYPSEAFYVDTITVGLEDGETLLESWLTVTGTTSFEANESTATLLVSSDNIGWALNTTGVESWLELVKEGSVIKLRVAKNTDAARKTSFVVNHATDSTKDQIIEVSQASGEVITEVVTATVAEFLASGVVESIATAQPYQLTGLITEVKDAEYGNLTLKDDTGSVLVYGLTATEQGIKQNTNGTFAGKNDKSFASLGLKAGDTVTLIGYHIIYGTDTHEVIGAYHVSHVAGDVLTTLEFPATSNLVVGNTKSIKAKVTPEEAVVAYTSSDTGVVTVDAEGNITGVAAGKATITASVAAVPGSYTAAEKTCEVTVTAEAATTVTDVLDRALTGVTATNSYSDWSGKTSNSDAVYAGNSCGDKESIQLRSKNSNSGVITTKTGGKARKVVVTWNSGTSSGRTLDVYGKDSAYSAATDLYNANNQGTKLGSIVMGTSTELEISGDYTYIGFRSKDGAMYLTKVEITWEQ